MAQGPESEAEGQPDQPPGVMTIQGKDIEVVTSSLEVPTMLVDGIAGTMDTNGIVRLSFYEDKLDVLDHKVKRRHVVSLAMAATNFRQIVDFLNKLPSLSGGKNAG